jgi:hypothetical protein
MSGWTTFTPDGRRLVVGRHPNGWTVECGERAHVQHELLDVALIEALRKDADVVGQSMRIDYAQWTRVLADRIQREATADEEQAGEVIPDKGDRIELREDRLDVAVHGTVEYADHFQVLVKWDDGRSSSLRLGADRFRILNR